MSKIWNHPCGCKVDMIKSPYRGIMRMIDGDPTSDIEVWWSYCQPGAAPLPYDHAFGSHVWYDERDPLPGFGEQGRLRPRGSGPRVSPLPGTRPCGGADVWRRGGDADTPPLHLDGEGVPLCCRVGVWPVRVELVAELVEPVYDAVPVEMVAGLVDPTTSGAVVEMVAGILGDPASDGVGSTVEMVAGLVDPTTSGAVVELVAELVGDDLGGDVGGSAVELVAVLVEPAEDASGPAVEMVAVLVE